MTAQNVHNRPWDNSLRAFLFCTNFVYYFLPIVFLIMFLSASLM